jgi:Zn-dependent M28 family amino/carboxypeptidase
MEGFRAAGWMADRHAFELKRARGYLDYEHGRYPAGAKPVIYPRLVGANVLAVKRGRESTDVVVVGAHHDTIRDSPGADDNTASVAALLELARFLGPYSFRDTIVLAAFDMEELSLFGSRELVRFIGQEQRIRGAIIYETMAYGATAAHTQKVPKGLALLYPSQVSRIERREFRGDWTAVLYRQSAIDIARDFAGALVHAAGPEMVILLRDPADLPVVGPLMRAVPLAAQFGRSDHQSFWRAGIPAILVTDTANFRNPHYHRPTDTPDTLDYPRVAAIVGATAIAVAKLAGWKSDEAGFNAPP